MKWHKLIGKIEPKQSINNEFFNFIEAYLQEDIVRLCGEVFEDPKDFNSNIINKDKHKELTIILLKDKFGMYNEQRLS